MLRTANRAGPRILPFPPGADAPGPRQVFSLTFPPTATAVRVVLECEGPDDLLDRLKVRMVIDGD